MDANWDNIMEDTVIFLRDVNNHGPKWNLPCRERRDVASLETLIVRHNLILDNELGVAIRPTQNSKELIIDLTYTTLDIRALVACVIVEELLTPSDHEIVVCHLETPDETAGGIRPN